jgi:hypothetical protein
MCLVGKLKSRRTLTSLAATLTHATATAMHFPANARLIFLTDELTRDRYLVDTGATLSIVPCTSKTTPSGPPLKGAHGQPIPSWGFVQKLSNSMANFFLCSFCKPLWQVPFSALISPESSKSLLPMRPAKYLLLALQRPGLPPKLFCLVLPVKCCRLFRRHPAPLHRPLHCQIVSIR